VPRGVAPDGLVTLISMGECRYEPGALDPLIDLVRERETDEVQERADRLWRQTKVLMAASGLLNAATAWYVAWELGRRR